MNPPTKPQPSWLLLVSSVLMMAVAVLMAGTLFSAVFSSDELSIVVGLFFLPVPLAFIVLQYWGTFHQHPGAAGLAGVLILAFGVFLFTPAAFGFLAFMSFGSWSAVFVLCSIVIPGIAVQMFFAHLNFHWATVLVSHYANSETNPPTFRFSLRELLGVMALVSIIVALGVALARSELSPMAEHVSSDQAPDRAYCKRTKTP